MALPGLPPIALDFKDESVEEKENVSTASRRMRSASAESHVPPLRKVRVATPLSQRLWLFLSALLRRAATRCRKGATHFFRRHCAGLCVALLVVQCSYRATLLSCIYVLVVVGAYVVPWYPNGEERLRSPGLPHPIITLTLVNDAS